MIDKQLTVCYNLCHFGSKDLGALMKSIISTDIHLSDSQIERLRPIDPIRDFLAKKLFQRNSFYPTGTGRLKKIGPDVSSIKVALCGDSTIDNGYWIQQNTDYIKKTKNVHHQIAQQLAENNSQFSYELANFAVDGATTTDMLGLQRLNKVLAKNDKDHF